MKRINPHNEIVSAEQTFIERTLIGWHTRHQERFTSRAAHTAFEDYFVRRLRANEGALDAIYIIALARRGHPAAALALRRVIIEANEADRFAELPLSIRAFNSELLLRGTLPTEYPSQASQVIDHYVRDIAVGRLVDIVKARFPRIPLLYSASEQRRSAVALVGGVFGLGEAQARRVYRDYTKLPQMVADFFHTYPDALTRGGLPNVR